MHNLQVEELEPRQLLNGTGFSLRPPPSPGGNGKPTNAEPVEGVAAALLQRLNALPPLRTETPVAAAPFRPEVQGIGAARSLIPAVRDADSAVAALDPLRWTLPHPT